jgi:hypothetical protein
MAMPGKKLISDSVFDKYCPAFTLLAQACPGLSIVLNLLLNGDPGSICPVQLSQRLRNHVYTPHPKHTPCSIHPNEVSSEVLALLVR